ncbi:MAG: protein kinase domain-containing protein, partial [Gemmataceae bacterium]
IDFSERERFLTPRAERLHEYATEDKIGQAMIHAGFLTPYQYDRLSRGQQQSLVLGSYRVLDELGHGGMGTVYLAEHRLMRRRVAIKVLPVDEDCPTAVRQRFYSEMRILAELSHPNIIMALDAGEIISPSLIYLVMELVEGGDLEKLVLRKGVLSIHEACDYIRQAALGLQAAHDHHLVHRDVKPSNLLLTSSNQVKLVDFGLARQFSSRLTDQRALLGSVEFMPPEQSHDPSLVSRQADIYGLGSTMFWLLTGQGPYPFYSQVTQALHALQHDSPRHLRSLRPDAPPVLDSLLSRMLDRDPAQRPPSALSVINELMPFLEQDTGTLLPAQPMPSRAGSNVSSFDKKVRALIVEEDLRTRMVNRSLMERLGAECVEARDAESALKAARNSAFDLVLLESILPDSKGLDLSSKLRQIPGNPNLKIIILFRASEANGGSGELPQGVDDFLEKPYEHHHLIAKVRHCLDLKAAQDRATHLADQMIQMNQQIELTLRARSLDLREAHNAIIFAMAKFAESKDGETPGHLKRMKRYCRALAQEVSKHPSWQGLVDDHFLEFLERCVPLHDIGKIALSDDVLLKPASLTPSERLHIQSHVVIGDQILEAMGNEHGATLEFLGMARVIVRHHHERYDGKGYPDQLAGDAIPPAARIVAVADVYDALRRVRMYKPAIPHRQAIRQILEQSPGRFDPTLLSALERCQGEFERIFQEIEE